MTSSTNLGSGDDRKESDEDKRYDVWQTRDAEQFVKKYGGSNEDDTEKKDIDPENYKGEFTFYRGTPVTAGEDVKKRTPIKDTSGYYHSGGRTYNRRYDPQNEPDDEGEE